jgi:hypothetical protein
MLISLLTSVAAAAPPSIYWTSTPTLANETLLIAGAGLGGAHVRLCADQQCNQPAALQPTEVAAWDLSVKMTLPPLQAPCFVHIGTPRGDVSFALNRPDVWWASTGAPSRHPPDSTLPNAPVLSPVITADAGLHVFGRALGWDAGSGVCINATHPAPAASTRLLLDEGTSLSAVEATCFEARFDTSALPVKEYTAVKVATTWGASEPFKLTVAASAPPSAPLVLDVLKDFHGDLAAALSKAASVGGQRDVEVCLGSHNYELQAPVMVPNRTTLRGVGAAETILSFSLGAPSISRVRAPPPPSPPAAMRTASNVQLLNFSMVVSSATRLTSPPWIGVWMPRGTSRVTMLGLNVTLASSNASNAVRIEGDFFEMRESSLWQLGDCATTLGSFFTATTLYILGARDGAVVGSAIHWKCSAFDIDVSQKIRFEQNRVRLLAKGSVPHGNSVSAYKGVQAGRLHSRWHSYARNSFERPACAEDAPGQCGPPANTGYDNWFQRESLTTDGAARFGAVGVIVSSTQTAVTRPSALDRAERMKAAATVHLNWTSWRQAPRVGTRLVVIAGPGVGQSRYVVGVPTNESLALDAPFDGHLTLGT